MSGATSRSRGHAFERKVAAHLSETLEADVRTARSVGRRSGADLVTVFEDGSVVPNVCGWSVELKASTDGHEVTAWMRQAKRQADSVLYCVVAKVPNRPLREATTYMTEKAFRWWAGDGLAVFDSEGQDVVWMSFGLWCSFLEMSVPKACNCGNHGT